MGVFGSGVKSRHEKRPRRFEASRAEILNGFWCTDHSIGVTNFVFYPLMENRAGLKYLAWPTRRIQSISS